MEYKRLADVDLKEYIGKRVFVTFLCRDVQLKLLKDDVTEYMSLAIQDRHKVENGVKIFNLTDYHREMVKAGFIYSAAIDVQRYEQAKGGYGLKVYNISMVGDNRDEYMDWCDGISQAANGILSAIENIGNNTYKEIVKSIMYSNWKKFAMYPAAKSMHHSALGGLCVHTYEVLECARAISNVIKIELKKSDMDMDLVSATCILHDIGKLAEFNVDEMTGRSEYSPEAALVTHIITAVELIDEVAITLKLGKYSGNAEEEKEIKLLKHCILSHHGKLEYGSPIEPSTIEAYIVSKADGISADVEMFSRAYSGMSDNTSMAVWSGGKLLTYYKN